MFGTVDRPECLAMIVTLAGDVPLTKGRTIVNEDPHSSVCGVPGDEEARE